MRTLCSRENDISWVTISVLAICIYFQQKIWDIESAAIYGLTQMRKYIWKESKILPFYLYADLSKEIESSSIIIRILFRSFAKDKNIVTIFKL